MLFRSLIETFNVELESVNLLAAAYANAASQARSLASGSPGLFNAKPGAAGAVDKLPKFASGGVVPGDPSKGDSVVAMVSPGETIVPTDRSKKYGSVLGAIMNDNLPGFAFGKRAINASQSAFVGSISSDAKIQDEIAKQLEFINKASADKLMAYAKATGKDVSDASARSEEHTSELQSH